MPEITTMCINQSCVAKDYCGRQTSNANKYQPIAHFKPKNNQLGVEFDCEHFYSRGNVQIGKREEEK